MNIFGAISGNGAEVDSDHNLKIQIRPVAITPNGSAFQATAAWLPSGSNTGSAGYPSANTWIATGSTTANTLQGAMTLLPNGKVLLALGNGTSTCNLYDPNTGTWTATGSTTAASTLGAMCLLPNGNVLYALGNGTAVCNIYEVSSGAWKVTGSTTSANNSNTGTAGCMCLLPNGKVLYVLNSGVCNLYDPLKGTWTLANPAPALNNYPSMIVLPPSSVPSPGGGYNNYNVSNEVLLITGSTTTTALYNITTGYWGINTSLPAAAQASSMCVLPSGMVLLINGSGSTNSYLFNSINTDPFSANSWQAVSGALVDNAQSAPMTLLPNGNVLAVMGDGTTACQIFDTVSYSWSIGPNLPSSSFYPMTCLLPNGQVLCVAGNTGTATYLYTPSLGFTSNTNSYSVGSVSSNSDLLSLFWSNNSKVCLIRKIRVQAFNSGGNSGWSGGTGPIDLGIFFARNYTSPDTGIAGFGMPYSSNNAGTSFQSPSINLAYQGSLSGTPNSIQFAGGNTNSNKVRTSLQQSVMSDLRFGQGGALLQGSYTLDLFPIARVQGNLTSSNGQIFGYGTDGSGFINLLDRPAGTYPLVLAQNEGIVIQSLNVPFSLTGTNTDSLNLVFEIEWEEVSSY